MADPSSDGIDATGIVNQTAVVPVNELPVPVDPATTAYSPGNQQNIEYLPTSIFVLEKVAALKQKYMKKSLGEASAAKVTKLPHETATITDGNMPCEQATRVDEALELHAPAEIDSTPETRKETKINKSEHRNTSTNVASVGTSRMTGNPTGSAKANRDSRKPDKPQQSTSKDRRPQSVVVHRERSPRSPTRREGVNPVDHRERNLFNRRDGLYRLSPEEYALIETRRNELSSVYKPTFRRK